jgi:uncharacterized membrane protein required for colicin V production
MMPVETIQKLNWIDVLIVVVILRALYIGLKRGFVNEIMQLVAILAATFIAFHYYPLCSHFLEKRFFLKPEIGKGVMFLVLWAVVALVSKFVRSGVYLLFKIEAKSFLDKAGGLSVALIRGFLIASLVLSLFATAGLEYLDRNIQSSYCSSYVAPLAPGFYRFVFKEFIAKYFPNEKMNRNLLGFSEEPVDQKQNEK